MKVVQLMVVLLALMACLFLVYFLVQYLLKNKKSSVVRSIVEKRCGEEELKKKNKTKRIFTRAAARERIRFFIDF